MKKFLSRLIQYMLSAYFVLTIYIGITMPTSPIYIISSLGMLSLGIFLSSVILGFLTIKENFLTSSLMISLISFGILFLLQEFMPGFNISEYPYEGINSGKLVIHSFLVTPIITMAILSITYSFISSLLKAFEKNS